MNRPLPKIEAGLVFFQKFLVIFIMLSSLRIEFPGAFYHAITFILIAAEGTQQ